MTNIIKIVFETIENLEGIYRENLNPGMKVAIVQKKDQRSGELTFGVIKRILTNKERHTRGIKVELTNGKIGRVQKILKK